MTAFDDHVPFAGATADEGQYLRIQIADRVDGVVPGYANRCAVTATSPASTSITVGTGEVIVGGGFTGRLTSSQDETVSANASGNPRIDTVVARLSLTSDDIQTVIIEGTPAASPSPPALTRSSSTWDVPLADIAVANGFSTIETADITDRRSFVGARRVASFVDSTARDKVIGSPQDGDLAYLTGTNELQAYDGSGWRTIVDLDLMEWSGGDLVLGGDIDGPATFIVGNGDGEQVTFRDSDSRFIVAVGGSTAFEVRGDSSDLVVVYGDIQGPGTFTVGNSDSDEIEFNSSGFDSSTTDVVIKSGRGIGLMGGGGSAAADLDLIVDGTNVKSPSIFNSTTATAANVAVGTGPNYNVQRSTSSRRWKSNIVDLEDALATVLGLRAVSFTSDNDGDTPMVGLIAEEVADVDERLITRDSDGIPDSVHYGHVVAPLIGAVQALAARVAELESQIQGGS